MADEPQPTETNPDAPPETPPAEPVAAAPAPPVDRDAIFKDKFREEMGFDYDAWKQEYSAPRASASATSSKTAEAPPDDEPADLDEPLTAKQLEKRLTTERQKIEEAAALRERQRAEKQFWAMASDNARRLCIAASPDDADVSSMMLDHVCIKINADCAAKGRYPTESDIKNAVDAAAKVIGKIKTTGATEAINKAAGRAANRTESTSAGARSGSPKLNVDYGKEGLESGLKKALRQAREAAQT